MNRREAMRRLALGTGTVVGASVVMSQPAFAYGGPTSTGDATLTANRGNDRRVDLSIGPLGSTTCSGSSTGSTEVFLDATVSTLALPEPGAYLEADSGSGWQALPQTSTSTTFRVRRVGSPNRFDGGDSFTVSIRVTHTCNYTGPGTGSSVRTTVRTVTWLEPPTPGTPIVA